MPRYDVFLEGRTENSTCYFGVAVMADDQKEAEFLGHEAGRRKHRECDEIEVVGVMPVTSARNTGKGRLCQRFTTRNNLSFSSAHSRTERIPKSTRYSTRTTWRAIPAPASRTGQSGLRRPELKFRQNL